MRLFKRKTGPFEHLFERVTQAVCIYMAAETFGPHEKERWPELREAVEEITRPIMCERIRQEIAQVTLRVMKDIDSEAKPKSGRS